MVLNPTGPSSVAGLDWAAQPENRAAAALQSNADGSLSLVGLTAPVSDSQAGRICRDPELAAVGVDIPFGWPARFVELVRAWNDPAAPSAPVPDYSAFCYRITDHHITEHLHKRPLSVSTDRIGVATRAWVQVVRDRNLAPQIDFGYGPKRSTPQLPALIEVYPGATLAALFHCRPEVTHEKYRKDLAVRGCLLDDLVEKFRLWVSEDQRSKLLNPRRWDEFDALVAALTAAIYTGMVPGREEVRPAAELRETVEREGWIFYPEPETAQHTEAQFAPRMGKGRGAMPKATSCNLEGETISVADALRIREHAGRDYPEFRCLHCGELVRPHQAGSTGQEAHFEHRKANPGCPYSPGSRIGR